jgi:hypothetical protein
MSALTAQAQRLGQLASQLLEHGKVIEQVDAGTVSHAHWTTRFAEVDALVTAVGTTATALATARNEAALTFPNVAQTE